MSQRTKWILWVSLFVLAIVVSVGGYMVLTGKWKIGASELYQDGSTLQLANANGEPIYYAATPYFTLNTGQTTRVFVYAKSCPSGLKIGSWVSEGMATRYPGVTVTQIGDMAVYQQTGCSVALEIGNKLAINNSSPAGEYQLNLAFSANGGDITEKVALANKLRPRVVRFYLGGSAAATSGTNYYKTAQTSMLKQGVSFAAQGAQNIQFDVWGGKGKVDVTFNRGVVQQGVCVSGAPVEVRNISTVNNPDYRPQRFSVNMPNELGCPGKLFGGNVQYYEHPLKITSADGVKQETKIQTVAGMSANTTETHEVSATSFWPFTFCSTCGETPAVVVYEGSITPTGGIFVDNNPANVDSNQQKIGRLWTAIAGVHGIIETTGQAVMTRFKSTPLAFSNQPGGNNVITSFVAEPAQVVAGGASTLKWTTSGASTCTLQGQGVATTGSQAVSPQTTTPYALACTDGTGKTFHGSVVVTVGSTSSTSSSPSTTATTPTATSTTATSDASSCSSSQIAFGAVPGAWNMKVMPATSNVKKISDLLGISDVSVNSWAYRGPSSSYQKTNSFASSNGMWFNSSHQPLCVNKSSLVSPQKEVKLPYTGLNMIANPFSSAISTGKIEVKVGNSGYVALPELFGKKDGGKVYVKMAAFWDPKNNQYNAYQLFVNMAFFKDWIPKEYAQYFKNYKEMPATLGPWSSFWLATQTGQTVSVRYR